VKRGVEKFNSNPAEIAALANTNWQKLHESK